MSRFIFSILILSFIFVSCEKQNSVVSNTNTTDSGNNKPLPDVYYRPVQNKNLAIMIQGNINDGSTSWLDSLKVIRSKFGFRYLFIHSDNTLSDPYLEYNKAIKAGFLPGELICQLVPGAYGTETTISKIDTMLARGITIFYLFEPLENLALYNNGNGTSANYSASQESIISYANHLMEKDSTAKLYISSNTDFIWVVKPDSTKNPISKKYYDIVQIYNNVWMLNDSYDAYNQQDIWDRYRANYFTWNMEFRTAGNLIDDKYDYMKWYAQLIKANRMDLTFMGFNNGNVRNWNELKLFCEAAENAGWLSINYNMKTH